MEYPWKRRTCNCFKTQLQPALQSGEAQYQLAIQALELDSTLSVLEPKAFANSLDPDETQQNMASHQDPNCLLF
ncbi:hypothetical protein DPMN_145708 [Dreissena polymorpha]|uniref:Uncharacterized protein n=1 Tax=Dreissena polymorpha TaxID=45954 RepID=A0A9D4J1M5_DREPO|nr:hypothetical protein DPMN_145708 [Dreissena polymorpha]